MDGIRSHRFSDADNAPIQHARKAGPIVGEVRMNAQFIYRVNTNPFRSSWSSIASAGRTWVGKAKIIEWSVKL
jgi:hypothetical protein